MPSSAFLSVSLRSSAVQLSGDLRGWQTCQAGEESTPLAGLATARNIDRLPSVQSLGSPVISKLLSFAGALIGGYAGWALGGLLGLMTAYTLSLIGTGAGIYFGRRFARQFE